MISRQILQITFLYKLILVTQLKDFTYFYIIQMTLFTINHLFSHILMLSKSLYITNNSIKRQSFVYTQLNVKIVVFQNIQYNINCQKQFY